MAGLIFGIMFLLVSVGLGVFFFVHKKTTYEEDLNGNYKRDGNGNRIRITTQPFKKFNMKKSLSIVVVITTIIYVLFGFCGCLETTTSGSKADVNNTINAANTIQSNQPTPTDISYSLERYNLIRRAYWVNGQREKANALPCEVEKPLGYIVLFAGNTVVGNFVVDGKVTSLNSFLTPDSEYYEYRGTSSKSNKWLADVNGSYGANDNGIFFFYS